MERRNREIYPPTFFPGNTPDDLANANKLRAEGHKRLIIPFYAISLALIATAGIIPFSSQRRKRWIAISLSGLTAIIFELTGMGILSLLAKTPQLTPLIYAHVFLTIAIVGLFIVKSPNLFNNVFYRKPNL
ncbi:LptF/LptG family permease [Alphaproteobacteria bacterium]|nr:LptF/LptG family permease [Alphaproteobacteria bacterium]